MIKRLQLLKSKRGFTVLELIVVVAIIAVMVASTLVSATNKRDKIKEANSAAQDFYMTLQSEVVQMQMFDGPLTMTLANAYSNHWSSSTTNNVKNAVHGGIKYYPSVGGNYPYNGFVSGDNHMTETPKEASLYVEFRVIGGVLKHVDYANELDVLLARLNHTTGGSEIGAVFMEEMKNKMEYKDGFYYAKISYVPPTQTDASVPLTAGDFSSKPVEVEWTSYCKKEVTTNASTNTFKTQGVLENGQPCGVFAHVGNSLGSAGTLFS